MKKSQIKVLYIMPTASLYGDNIALLNIIPALIDKGITPFFVITQKGVLANHLDKLGYRYIETPVFSSTLWSGSGSKIKRLIFLLRRRIGRYTKHRLEEKELRKAVMEFNPDIVHTNNTSCQLGYDLAKSLNVPHIWHIREYGDYLWDYFPTTNAFLSKVNSSNNYAITITDRIQKHFNLRGNSIAIYDGVFNKANHIGADNDKEKYFLFVGRLVEIKGIELIIEAFYEFRKSNPEYKLKLLGDTNDDEYKSNLIKWVGEHGLGPSVEFLGYRSDVHQYMRNATALISACKQEAFGFTIAEAMYSGCPVIGIDTCGTAQQFDNAENKVPGYKALRFKNSHELSLCMNRIVSEPLEGNLLKKLQDAVYSLYSIGNSANGVYSFYDQILR